MSRFQTEKKLPTLHLDFDSLQRIEEFLIKDLPKEILNAFPKGVKSIYFVTLTDKRGSDELKSIKEFKSKFLADSLSLIEFQLLDEKKEFEITINLDKEEGALLILDFKLEDARSVAVKFQDKLDQVIDSFRSVNWFFHPPEILSVVIAFGIIMTGIISFGDLSNGKYIEAVGPGLIFLSLGSYYYVGKHIRTPVSFDTRRYQIFNNYLVWFISGNLSFLIFGTIFTFLRDKIIEILFN
ncbi:hypothetical protein LEP1GSC050_0128 [Leptospira broomii serovar Hurstbridge str. 5399]|uniref:Uncharacterized protein n=1 Tax=Leptospira broomii serovar Hurstbridge str. 5399 TaxID=1049789 RepID=T0FEL9_9LEPT|nr:hypothetical protein [Leptospira broomii]EQA46336.1 hypothetical protein LEP1GSC050_0128 [Leptospira broomii serovar Hurstbridge str. 5399]